MDLTMSLIPSALTQNFLTQVRFDQGRYTATEGYSVTCVLTGPTTITFVATEEDGEYLLSIVATTAGLYNYTIAAEKLGVKTLIATGRVMVHPDPTAITAGSDLRTHAEKVLEAIEAVLEKRATTDQQSYTIAGRSISRIPVGELLMLRDKYKQEVKDQKFADKGKKAPRAILYRFGSR
jgi:hypothetical protein